MKDQEYKTQFSVFTIPKEPSMFLMNMRVYDDDKTGNITFGDKTYDTKLIKDPDNPHADIWCAVYNINHVPK